MIENMGKVIGIGGVFLGFKGDTSKLLKWYHDHLGVGVSTYGINFTEGEQLSLVTLTRKPDSEAAFINFRVDDITSLVQKLKNEKCEFTQEIEHFDYGKFATFIDPFGNKIELWEPHQDNYKDMVKKEESSAY